jgi:hypothetical protein
MTQHGDPVAEKIRTGRIGGGVYEGVDGKEMAYWRCKALTDHRTSKQTTGKQDWEQVSH